MTYDPNEELTLIESENDDFDWDDDEDEVWPPEDDEPTVPELALEALRSF